MKAFDYREIPEISIEACLFYLTHSEKERKKIKNKPEKISHAKVRQMVCLRLQHEIMRSQRYLGDVCKTRPFEIMIVNTLNLQISIIQSFFPAVTLPPVNLRQGVGFHHDLVALFSHIEKLKQLVIDMDNNDVANNDKKTNANHVPAHLLVHLPAQLPPLTIIRLPDQLPPRPIQEHEICKLPL